MKEIPLNELVFEKASFTDPVGKVFYWNNQVFRAIKKSDSKCLDLLHRDDINQFFESGLIRTKETNFQVAGFEKVLWHERINFVSYPVEWCSLMLRDAGMSVLNLQEMLLNNGYMLKDGHPWNVLFEKGKPVFVDFGSISKIDNRSIEWFIKEFRMRFVFPLYLRSAEQHLLARYLLMDPTHFLEETTIFKSMLHKNNLLKLARLVSLNNSINKQKEHKTSNWIGILKKQLSTTEIGKQKTEWSNYTGIWEENYTPDENWRAKNQSVRKILDEIRPKTVLDIGANKGWFSGLAESLGSKVVALDIDEPSIGQLYEHVKQNKLNILPLLVDICDPTHAHGPRGIMQDSTVRLRSEMVLALAISHHLLSKKGLSFDQLVSYLSEFSEKYLLVEFVSKDDVHIKTWNFPNVENYCIDVFIAALKKSFREVIEYPSYPNSRSLLLCKKQQ